MELLIIPKKKNEKNGRWCWLMGGGPVGDLGFQLRQTLRRCHLVTNCYHPHYWHCVWLCVCLCVGERQRFLKCVGGVISLRYIAPLQSLFKG